MATSCVRIKWRSFNPYGGLRDPWTSVVTGRVLLEGSFFESQPVTKPLRHHWPKTHVGGALLFRRGLIGKRAKLNEPRNGRNHEKG
jgi:hypothetical protein